MSLGDPRFLSSGLGALVVVLGSLTLVTAAADEPPVRLAITDLQSSLPKVREHAAVTLGRAADATSVPALIRALQDTNAGVRREAAKALGFIKDPRAVAGLLAALADDEANVRMYAAYALGEIKDECAAEALVGALADPEWTVRDQAAWALREVADKTLPERLVKMLIGQAEPRAATAQIIWVLEHVDREAALKHLVAALDLPDARSRLAAVRVLGQLQDQRVFQPVLTTLKDSDPRVRLASVKVLAALGDIRALERLTRLVADATESAVRDAAQEAVVRLSRDDTLMAHWSFDDKSVKVATDVTGRGNDGVVNHCISVPGKVGSALKFGPGRFVELGRLPDVPLANLPLTITAWVKSETSDGVVVARGGAFCGFSLYLKNGAPRFGIHRVQDGPTYIASGQQKIVGRWTFLAGVVKADRIELVVDGRLVATEKTKGFIPSNCGQGMEIGFDAGNSPAEIVDHFNGIIDEVKVYQVALSTDELAAKFRRER